MFCVFWAKRRFSFLLWLSFNATFFCLQFCFCCLSTFPHHSFRWFLSFRWRELGICSCVTSSPRCQTRPASFTETPRAKLWVIWTPPEPPSTHSTHTHPHACMHTNKCVQAQMLHCNCPLWLPAVAKIFLTHMLKATHSNPCLCSICHIPQHALVKCNLTCTNTHTHCRPWPWRQSLLV